MSFEPVQLRGGAVAIRASGMTEKGDAERLTSVLDRARPTRDGWIPLLLASPGGEVEPALKMSLIIRDRRLMPVVLPGDTCESSCAVILFLAGQRSLLTKGGTLFFHSCISERTPVEFLKDCNQIMSDAMRHEHEITDEMLLLTLNAFAGDEDRVPREQRLIHANVADCMAIDLPPWSTERPNPSRCGTGDLMKRDPMFAGVDMDGTTARQPENLPGQLHPVWFLFHWTPPDQWAFWREEDGVALGLRPRNTFRNGPELRLSCLVTGKGDPDRDDLILDLRLPDSERIRKTASLSLRIGKYQSKSTPFMDRMNEGPLVVAGNPVTMRFSARFPAKAWSALATEKNVIVLSLLGQSGSTVWRREYPVNGLSKRIDAVRSNCVGALRPEH